ncbi:MAG: metal-dependent hydrolase [Deltaproteobacteria bacterium]|nr:metal-dependent hydrolase [Deltaproteobacteria bacterium]
MVGPSHAVCALGVVVAAGHLTGVTPTRIELFVYLLGALAPDLDGDGSIARPGTILKTFLGWKIAKLVDQIGITVSKLANALCGHRGLFHWPAVALLFILCGYFLGLPLLRWFGYGYLVHILCDCLTFQGIALLAPFRFRNYSLSLFSTGSLRELLIVSIVFCATVYWGFALLPSSLQEGFHTLHSQYFQEKGRLDSQPSM